MSAPVRRDRAAERARRRERDNERALAEAAHAEKARLEAPPAADRVTTKLVLKIVGMLTDPDIGIFEMIEEWRAEDAERTGKGPGGRPPLLTDLHVLVAMVLCAMTTKALTGHNIAKMLYLTLPKKARKKLGIAGLPDCRLIEKVDVCTGRDCKHPLEAGTQRVYRALRRLATNVDGYQEPLGKRLARDDYDAIIAQLDPEDLERKLGRLAKLMNAILEVSLRAAGPTLAAQLQNANVGCDGTFIAMSTRPAEAPKGKGSFTDRVTETATDPSAGWCVHSSDAPESAGGTTVTDDNRDNVKGYGLQLHLLVATPDTNDGPLTIPAVVTAMSTPSRPGTNITADTLRCLHSHTERGHATNHLAIDRGISGQRVELLDTARALGFTPVMDYKIDQCGIQASTRGAILVEGVWYCPAMPENLINATIDYRRKRIDRATYIGFIDARRPYRLKRKSGPDSNVYGCPATNWHPTAICEIKDRKYTERVLTDPNFKRNAIRSVTPVKIVLTERTQPVDGIDGPAERDICAKDSVTIDGGEKARRYEQEYDLMSPEWYAFYSTIRSANEGGNGTAKSEAGQALERARRRPMLGAALAGIFAAVLVAANNLAILRRFARRCTAVITSDGERYVHVKRNRSNAPDRRDPNADPRLAGPEHPDDP